MKANEELKIKLRKFCTDKRAYYSLVALAIAFLITLPAELICNVRPLLLVVEGKPYFPILFAYSEKDFGGTLPSEPDYKSGNFLKLLNGGAVPGELQPQKEIAATDEEVEENILHLEMSDFEEEDVEEAEFSIGLEDFEEEESSSPTKQVQIAPPPGAGSQAASEPKEYWMIWPPVRYDYQYIPTESKTGRVVLAAPYETPSADGTRTIPSSWQDGHYLGTDDRGRDVLARLIYGFRVSMIFGLSLAITGTILGCLLGGIQG
ncbi:MAG: peptide ABC transporter permease, partial [Nitrospinae bacterium]|nr:peptide ABC transporter permease [Nitrospinota bacterium]